MPGKDYSKLEKIKIMKLRFFFKRKAKYKTFLSLPLYEKKEKSLTKSTFICFKSNLHFEQLLWSCEGTGFKCQIPLTEV